MLATNNAIELEVLDIVYLFLIFSMCNDINKYKQYYTNGILIINNYSISKNKYYTLIQKLISKQRAQSNSKYQQRSIFLQLRCKQDETIVKFPREAEKELKAVESAILICSTKRALNNQKVSQALNGKKSSLFEKKKKNRE